MTNRELSANVSMSAFVLAVLVAAAGCFKSPDLSRIECFDSEHCPAQQVCVITPPATVGLCARPAVALDGSPADVVLTDAAADRTAQGEVGVLAEVNGAVDQQPAADVGTAEAAGTDTASDGGRDAALDSGADLVSDVTVPDTAAGADAGIDVGADLADVAPVQPDAQPDRPADIAPGKPRGTACGADGECADGFCADGFCCDSACKGTCQACDLTRGTCTTLAAGAPPRPGHGACTAADPTCAGACNGTSSACTYPTSACGTASCTGTTYQPAGACAAGACQVPASQSCPANQTCSSNACACLTPMLSCTGACVDPATDVKNCGACGHDCKGGACLQGRCQPVVIAGNLADFAGVFGVDSQNVYYWVGQVVGSSYDMHRVTKSAVNGSGTFISNVDARPQGVMGSTIFFVRDRFGYQSTCLLPSCATLTDLPLAGGMLADFRSPAPPSFAQGVGNNPGLTINWYNPQNNALVTSYDDVSSPLYSTNRGFFAHGKMVYWIRDLFTATGDRTDSLLHGVDSTTSARSQLAGGMPSTLDIVDANPISILLQDASSGDIHRALLPFGTGAQPPPLVLAGAGVRSITEATTGIYWVDDGGTVYKCSATDCTGTKTILTSGQDAWYLYQDDTRGARTRSCDWSSRTNHAARAGIITRTAPKRTTGARRARPGRRWPRPARNDSIRHRLRGVLDVRRSTGQRLD